MSTLLPFIIAGIVSGAVYGLAATGLVLTYKTSGIFNFGHGALATISAYVFYYLHVSHGINWELSAAVAVLVVGPLMGLVLEVMGRQLARQRPVWKIVGTSGIILLVQALGTLAYGVNGRFVPQYLPGGNSSFRVSGVNIAYSQVIIAAIALVAVVAFYIVFRVTRIGVSMRAVVDDPDLVNIQGTNPVLIRRLSWITGSTLAALSGVLILPLVGLDPIILTFLIVQAFAAAAIGGFSNIPLTFAGGLIVGIISSVLTKYGVTNPSLSSLSQGLPFAILIVVVLVTPRRKLLPPSTSEKRPGLQWHGPPVLRIGAYILVFGFLASVPAWTENYLLTPYWTGALTTIILMLSLGLLVRTAGIVSLCTAGLAAVGAVAFSQFDVDAHLPWLLSLLLAGLVAVPVGALIAIPAIRLSGLFLALSTLGFGLLLAQVLYGQSFMFTLSANGRVMPRPSWASSDSSYYFLVLAVVVVAVAGIAWINRSRLGRVLQGMSDSPTAVSALGLSLIGTRVTVFCISAFLAAIAGALYGSMLGFAGATTEYYSSFTSITLVATLVLVPFRAPWYAIIAGITQVIPGYLTGANTPYVLNALFGFFSILVAVQGGPIQMPVRWQRLLESKFGRSHGAFGVRLDRPGLASAGRASGTLRTGPASGLSVRDLSVNFGGLLAVDGLGLDAPNGRITGLIGPNGAGKTTMFNACSGLNQPSAGRILLNGEDVSRRSPSRRARSGLGRTFQVMELFDSLTVADNVALGRESSQAGSNVLKQLLVPRSELRVRDAATKEALELCGITDLAQIQSGELSTGHRRLVELARCVAGPFDTLLLDEPSSGLDRTETEQFAALLRHLVAQRGCGILLVEHDMSLVLDVCEYIYVLDFGKLIFEGTPQQVAESEIVRTAYLGVDEVVVGAHTAGVREPVDEASA